MPANLVFATTNLLDTSTFSAGTGYIDYPIFNGYRDVDIRRSGTVIEQLLQYSSTQVQKIDYLILARADRLQKRGSTQLSVEGSISPGAYTVYAGTSTSFASKTLYGVRGTDALFTAELANSDSDQTITRSFDRLKLKLSSTITPTTVYNRVFAGSWFDLDRDPENPASIRKVQNSVNSRESAYEFTFTWRGLSDSVLNSFLSNIVLRRNNSIYMYTKSYHQTLLGFRCLHCFPISFSTSRRLENTNDITVTFEELI